KFDLRVNFFLLIKKTQHISVEFFGGESRIRTCEGFPTDLQSVLVGRLSISPSHILRRKRDSNPRTCYSQQFSRLPHSTTLPFLLGLQLLGFPVNCDANI